MTRMRMKQATGDHLPNMIQPFIRRVKATVYCGLENAEAMTHRLEDLSSTIPLHDTQTRRCEQYHAPP